MNSTFLTNSWNQITKVNYYRINYKKRRGWRGSFRMLGLKRDKNRKWFIGIGNIGSNSFGWKQNINRS